MLNRVCQPDNGKYLRQGLRQINEGQHQHDLRYLIEIHLQLSNTFGK